MTASSGLILSNRLDVLADLLAKVLEQEISDPFGTKVILVPSQEMKHWLFLELAKRSQRKAIAGIKIFPWQEGIRYLLNQPGKELSDVELYLFIYKALERSENEEVQEYIRSARLENLASEMTDLFLRYGYYGKNLRLKGDWQSQLWNSLFVEGPWRVPVQLLQKPLSIKADVYVFNCSSMPEIVWEALVQTAQVQIFLFSPCLYYWSDSLSDQERRSLIRYGKKRHVKSDELEELQEYLLENHPLLANWGKVGRDAFNLLDSYNIEVEPLYDPLDGKESLLAKVQKDLLFHRISESLQDDGSLRVHQTGASLLREVQVLKDEMIRAHQSGIDFSDMLVLVPDMDRYAPLIEMVFEDPEMVAPYHIEGVDGLSQNSSWQGFKHLLRLGQSRWDADSLLCLFENGSFREKRGWDVERLDQVRGWIEEARIRWGHTEEEKEKILSEWQTKGAKVGKRGTWEEGVEKLLNSLVYLFPELTEGSINTLEGVGLGVADAVEEFLELLFALQTDLAKIKDSFQSVSSWADLLQALFEKYLMPDSDELEKLFYSLRKAGEKMGEDLPFSALIHLFERKQAGRVGSTLLHAARFAPLKEGMVAPCRALFLLGLDEETFPKRSSRSSLDFLRGTKEDPPNASDLDRYLFLEALCTPKDLLVISYGHISPEDGKEMNPSILVRELLDYVKVVPPILHPSFPWHKRALLEKNCLLTSPREYRAALAFQGAKEPLACLSSFEQIETAELPETETTVSIRDLKKCFRSPWEFFLGAKLDVRFEETEKEDWSDFAIDGIFKSQILKKGLQTSLSSVVDHFEQKGHFPVGLFGKKAKLEIAHTFSEWEKCAEEWNLLPLRSIHLEMTVTKHCRLVGEIKHVSQKRVVHFGDDSFSSLLKNWPEYLAALITLKTHEIFCIKSGKIRRVEDPEAALKNCLELYFLALKTPLPLASQWTDELIRKQDPVELEKKFSKTQTLWEDPIYDWVCLRSPPFSAEKIISAWSPYLREKLQGLIELYPLGGRKHAKV